ncbi:MAG: cobalamin biosynthesis protein CobD [Rhodospirillales bacterium]|nr:cobalamin biosynthesis protein CobD [Rhodospirillales bacterium]
MFALGTGDVPGIDNFALLLAAMLIEALIGEARPLFLVLRHPIRLIGDIVDFLDRKLNREHRSNTDLAVRGALVVLLMVAGAGSAGWGLAWGAARNSWAALAMLVLLVPLLAGRSLYDHVRAVAEAMERKGVEAGRSAVGHIVGRETDRLDSGGVARAAIESLAENFSDAVVAPVFWFALFGFPGLLVYKVVNTMDSMIGHVKPKYRAFGFTAARLDDVLNLAPARLAALVIALAAAAAPTASPGAALRAVRRDAGKHRSPNSGWPEAAMAGALGLALAGPRHYAGQVFDEPWIGDGRKEATARDIRLALYVYVVACLLIAALVAAILFIRLRYT